MIVVLTSECLLNEIKDDFMEQIWSKEHYLIQLLHTPGIWLQKLLRSKFSPETQTFAKANVTILPPRKDKINVYIIDD